MRQQRKWSTGIFVAVGTLVALAVAGCGGSSDSAEQRDSAQQQPDGTPNYADLEELHAAVIDAGVDCGPLDVSEGTSLASAQGTCELGGDRLVLQLWEDATHRDEDATTI